MPFRTSRLPKLAFFLVPMAAFAGQSLRLNGSQTASNSSVAAQPANGACRAEFQLTFTANPSDGTFIRGDACGWVGFYTSGFFSIYPATTTNGWACCYNISLGAFPSNWINLRVQQIPSGAGGTITWEAWDINGIRQISHTQVYTATSGSHSNGASVGSTGSQNSSWGYFRMYSTTVPLGSAEPTFADTGNLLDWKFNNSLNDTSGHGYTASSSAGSPANSCGTAPCYEPSLGQNLVTAVIKTNPAPTWSNWQSWRAGTTVGLDGSASISMGDSGGTPNLVWQILSGPSVPVWSSHTAVQPTLTGIVFGNYRVQLVATNANGGSAVTTQDIGAVAYDDNGVVIPADPRVTEIFGPQIAFGQNPWGWEDERNLHIIASQTAYQAGANDFGWTTPGQGTVSYQFAGKGFYPAAAGTGTTICGSTSCNGTGISATDTSISIQDATKLSLTSLPTWILAGSGYPSLTGGSLEMIRVTACTSIATGAACTGTTTQAVLTVAYDGRGMSGNNTGIGGYSTTVGATPWANGTSVGEYRIQGAGTLFSSDASRPICPAGVPGPPGPVTYSTGTATLSAGSTTVTGSGTAWTSAMVGGYIRVAATHGGASFIFWRQIASFTDGTHLVMDRAAPTGVDGSAFPYKITSPAMFLSLEVAAPDGHTLRMLQNGVGCESETAMFALVTHDAGSLNATSISGLKYSYKGSFGEISNSGTFDPNFYGVGLAARSFYYRSGYGPALDLANSIDEYWTRDPQIADGFINNQPLSLGGGVIGAFVDLVLNPSTALTWPNLEAFAEFGKIQATACNADDTRNGGYKTAWLTLAANYDTNSTNRAAYKNALGLSSPSVLSRANNCKRNAPDGYSGAEVNSFSNSFVFNPAQSVGSQPLVLTNGSTAVTGSGFTSGNSSAQGTCYGVDIVSLQVTHGSSTATVTSGTLTQQNLIYFYDGTNTGVYEYSVSGTAVQLGAVWNGSSGTFSAMSTGGGPIVTGGQVVGGYGGILAQATPTSPPADNFANNEALRRVWACKWNSSSSLTLFRPWDGTSTSALTGGLNYYISYYNIGTFGQQPFMYGVLTNAMNWASKNDDATIASTANAMLPLMGEWFNSYGWDRNNANHGTFYNAVAEACGSPADVPAGSFASIHGYQGCGSNGLAAGSAAIARVNGVEGGSAMIQYYLANPNAERKAAVDTFYGAIFGNVPNCDPSVLSTCDGTIAENYTDLDLSHYKWPGFFFGMGGFFANSWPAVRMGGIRPAEPRTLNVTCNISSVANATQCRVTLTKPDGSTVTNTCATSPCAVTADAREGDHLLKVEYLSASNAVLAAGQPGPVRVN